MGRRLFVLLSVILLAACSSSHPGALGTPSATASATVVAAATPGACATSPELAAPASVGAIVGPSGAIPFHVAVIGDSLAAGDDGVSTSVVRWWSTSGLALKAARPDREVTVSNFGQRGSGIEHVEQTVASLDARSFQVAIILEGRNDYQSVADWSPRVVKVMQTLERQGVIVILATTPPTLSKAELLPFSRNACIHQLAGSRPLLDFEARWIAAGPTGAAAWYSDTIHASEAGQLVEAQMATALLLGLMK